MCWKPGSEARARVRGDCARAQGGRARRNLRPRTGGRARRSPRLSPGGSSVCLTPFAVFYPLSLGILFYGTQQ